MKARLERTGKNIQLIIDIESEIEQIAFDAAIHSWETLPSEDSYWHPRMLINVYDYMKDNSGAT